MCEPVLACKSTSERYKRSQSTPNPSSNVSAILNMSRLESLKLQSCANRIIEKGCYYFVLLNSNFCFLTYFMWALAENMFQLASDSREFLV